MSEEIDATDFLSRYDRSLKTQLPHSDYLGNWQ